MAEAGVTPVQEIAFTLANARQYVRTAIAAGLRAVEDRGGAVAAIEQGFRKSEIERSAYRIAREIDGGERPGRLSNILCRRPVRRRDGHTDQNGSER